MKYYFTFGQAHYTTDGYPMMNNWVTVIANDYGEARELFIEKFTSLYMENPDKFAFQYEEKDFESEYFPKGEFMLITS